MDYIAKTQLSIYCVCGSDLDYSNKAESLIKEIKQQHPHIKLYVAGKQPAELETVLLESGVDNFIHVKTNVVAVLTELLQELGVNEQ